MSTLTPSPVGFTIYPEDPCLDDIIEIARHRRPVSWSSDPEFRRVCECIDGRKISVLN